MNNLTFIEPNGNWGVVGMNKENVEDKMLEVAMKLRDYEQTGMEPEEVAYMKENAVDYMIKQLEIERDKIDQELENPQDPYNNLLLLRKISDMDIAIRVIRKNIKRGSDQK